MTSQLPPNLLKLFAPRPAIPYAKPLGRDIDRPLNKAIPGVFDVIERVRQERAERGEEALEAEERSLNPEAFTDSADLKIANGRAERKRRKEETYKKALETYKPKEDEHAVGDPYRTIFISRLHRDATEEQLRKEFDLYGRIENLKIIRDSKEKSRGYAFILYERERDMKAAYKDADGLKILGKRILVDVERGRTVKGWKPRRLGGGLGGLAKPAPAEVPSLSSFRGGMRGARGGGMRGGPGGFSSRGGAFNGGGRGGYSDGPPRGAPAFGGGYGGPPSRPPGAYPDAGGFGDRGGYGARPPPSKPLDRYGSSYDSRGSNGTDAFGQNRGPPRGAGIGYAPSRDTGDYGGSKRDYDRGPHDGAYQNGYGDPKRARY
ncbi:hypothetical protein E5Q_06166 [Mixia osmundae IAM 14324]|uniref:U1 small nuclear ribonucleoprotein 70 kDa n=1 Tax=Mixia osmundae (strain CBS 9802 / IAM 14324 / JCM 22182 / KY 12970) TaxID=764103 RepID=G7E9Z8_MIXOS|nr:hypothetical protein E5Q_06166 [Mixia osmundae IAM 14324]